MDFTTVKPLLDTLTFNGALVLAVLVLWRELKAERQKRDESVTKLHEQTRQTLSEFAGAIKAQADSLNSLHATIAARVGIDDTRTSPPRDRDIRIALAQNGAAGD